MKKTIIVLFIFLAGFAAMVYPALVKAKIGAYVVNHLVIYKGVHNYHKQNNAYPHSLDELGVVNDEFAREKVVYYQPNDESDGNFIILRSKLFGREIITRKNGEVDEVKGGRVIHRTKYSERWD